MKNLAITLRFVLSFLIIQTVSNQIKGTDNDDFFKREHEYVKFTGGGLCGVYRTKKRHGPPGPDGLIEVSPWVRSVEYLKKIPVGTRFDFVFDCENESFYIRAPDIYGGRRFKQIGGHPHISFCARTSSGCGGEFWKVSEDPLIFRSNESSGHRGLFWTDKRRFSYLTLLSTSNVTVYHEPFTLDEYKFESGDIKKIVEGFILYTFEQSICVRKMKIFEKLSLEDLRLFQKNFYRKFGNSIFNLGFHFAVFPRSGSKINYNKKLYEQDEKGNLTLKELYRRMGYLDMEFDFVNPIIIEEMLLKKFMDKY